MKNPKIVPFRRSPDSENPLRSDIVFRIGGQTIKIDFAATVTDITGTPTAPVVSIANPKPDDPGEEPNS